MAPAVQGVRSRWGCSTHQAAAQHQALGAGTGVGTRTVGCRKVPAPPPCGADGASPRAAAACFTDCSSPACILCPALFQLSFQRVAVASESLSLQQQHDSRPARAWRACSLQPQAQPLGSSAPCSWRAVGSPGSLQAAGAAPLAAARLQAAPCPHPSSSSGHARRGRGAGRAAVASHAAAACRLPCRLPRRSRRQPAPQRLLPCLPACRRQRRS